jgi:DNA-binding response OmpR family regulator
MPKLILCVEDEPLSAEAVRRALNFAGFDVVVAASAAGGLESIQKRTPDLILLDILLPDVNGYSFIDLLREQNGLPQIPIVIVSGCVSEEAQTLGRDLGAKGYLTKPFTAKELIDCVQGVLGAGSSAEV